jgi:hypothetical protein
MAAIFVTGRTGYIGGTPIEAVMPRGHTVMRSSAAL